MKKLNKKNVNQHVIPDLIGYPSENKALYNLDSRVKPENGREVGRSMVEMLGVLAIIGVLSVGGIAGYTSAMRQYKANEIVNATSMLYMMGASQNQGAGDTQILYSAVLGTVPSGVSEITYNKDKTISLAFTDPDVCPLAKNKLGDKATDECPTLTVSFGETGTTETTDNIPEIDSECTPGTSGTYYVCYGSQIFVCDNGDDGVNWRWGVHAMARCIGSCKDHRIHSSMEDTCTNLEIDET